LGQNLAGIHGIGFKTADQIAQKIGIPVDSLLRACAGLSHVLIEAIGEGHCVLPVELLKEEAAKLLLVDDKIVTVALEHTLASNDLVKETINGQDFRRPGGNQSRRLGGRTSGVS